MASSTHELVPPSEKQRKLLPGLEFARVVRKSGLLDSLPANTHSRDNFLERLSVKYPKLVNMAWEVIDDFVKEWQANPFLCEWEADYQVAIASRLISALKRVNEDVVLGNYPTSLEEYSHLQRWCRVSCEPMVSRLLNGTKRRIHPDIVMWDSISNPDAPPDVWPMLFACEIKVNSEGGLKNDIDRLKALVSAGHLEYGCVINFSRKHAEHSGHNMACKIRKLCKSSNRLWEYRIRVPLPC